MKNVVKTFQQLSRNQKKLLERSEYLMTEIINLYYRQSKHEYEHAVAGEEKNYTETVKAALFDFDEGRGKFEGIYGGIGPAPFGEIAPIGPGEACSALTDYELITIPLMRENLKYNLERDHYGRLANIAKNYSGFTCGEFENIRYRIENKTKIENLEIPKIVEVKIGKIFSSVMGMKEIVGNQGGIVFHTFSSDIAEDEGIVFLNIEKTL